MELLLIMRIHSHIITSYGIARVAPFQYSLLIVWLEQNNIFLVWISLLTGKGKNMYKFEELMTGDNLIDGYDFPDDLLHMIMESDPDDPDSWLESLDIEVVYEIGGREGGGESVVRVYKVTNHIDNEVHYFQLTGCYESYNGTEWDDELVEVFPHQVMVTQYY
jgi:hypothetical protein